tara:strand:+ start:29 stop:346 length:318 start_codon:yes stop_codon:yes gene_type:complete
MSKVPDNVKSDFPARMSDGRFITDYTPNCQHNLAIQKDMTSWQYKTYLTRYADQIMKNINSNNIQYYGCETCDGTKTISPPKVKQDCTMENCTIKPYDPNGIAMY